MKGRRLRDGFETGSVRSAVEPVLAAAPVTDAASPLRAATTASAARADFGGLATEAERRRDGGRRFARWGWPLNAELAASAFLGDIAAPYIL